MEDKNHPATKHLGDSFEITDEIYQFKGPYDRKNLNILLSMDTTAVKKKANAQTRIMHLLGPKNMAKAGFFTQLLDTAMKFGPMKDSRS